MGRKLQGSILCNRKEYECQYTWPDDCFTQYGDSGIVFQEGTMRESLHNPEKGLKNFIDAQLDTTSAPKHYKTAFFEAFPENPRTFIRGEGSTVEEAETSAWNKFKKYSACNNHSFERKKYRNGAGICTKCGMFKSKVFEPLERCIVCKDSTYYSSDKLGNWYCEKDVEHNPDRLKYE